MANFIYFFFCIFVYLILFKSFALFYLLSNFTILILLFIVVLVNSFATVDVGTRYIVSSMIGLLLLSFDYIVTSNEMENYNASLQNTAPGGDIPLDTPAAVTYGNTLYMFEEITIERSAEAKMAS